MQKLTLVVVASCMLSACAVFDPDGPNTTKFRAPEMLDKPVETIDLIALVSNGHADSKRSDGKGYMTGEEFAAAFEKALRESKPDKETRNRIQDRLILSSNKLCENFKITLKKKQANANFLTGVLATTFGAVGAVVQSAEGARYLAGLSGLTSGVKAEYNSDYFADVAAQVITKGINSRRQDILERINSSRGKEPKDYTLEAAISEAILYHGACSMVAGLEQADAAVATLDGKNIGLDAMYGSIQDVEKARLEAQKSIKALQEQVADPASQ